MRRGRHARKRDQLLILRPYQHRAIDLLRARWRDRPILCLATGGGKTVVLEAIINGAESKKRRVLGVAHTRQIVHQTARRFRAAGIRCAVDMADERATDEPVVIASIQTLARRDPPPHDILVIDEAHHAVAQTYRDLILAAPVVIGLTATPCRLDGRGLGEVGFGCIVEPITPRELRDQGFLCDPTLYALPGLDETKLRKIAGEFSADSAHESVKLLHGSIVKHWLELAGGGPTVAFACDVAHANEIAQNFRDAGVPAEAVSGKDCQERRDDVLAALADGSIKVVANCQLYGEGWDLPSLECAILARPTASFVVHRQQCGRVLRPVEGKTALILDHAGNLARHGSPFDDCEWSLDGRPRRAGVTPHRTCPKCYAVVPAASAVCPECGFVFGGDSERKDIEESSTRLEKWNGEDRAARYLEFVAAASRYEYKLGWARMRFKQSFGEWPRFRKIEQAHYVCSGHVWKTGQWGTYCERCFGKAGVGE